MVPKIEKITLENFKSYEGTHEIGPFSHFSAIIGPNGAGKSNLMDAISFVLGVQSKQLRSSNLRDLIFRRETDNPKKQTRKACVQLQYRDKEDNLIVFERQIAPGGEGRFKIDGKTVSEEDYSLALSREHIMIKAKNFLIFQGEVEQVAQKDPKELTSMFEQISGSGQYAKKFTELHAAKAEAEDKARLIFVRKRNEMAEKKLLKDQKEEAEQYQDMLKQQEDYYTKCILLRLFEAEKVKEEQQTICSALRVEHNKALEESEAATSTFKNAEKNRAALKLETEKINKQLAKIERDFMDKKNKMLALKARLDHCEKCFTRNSEAKNKAFDTVQRQEKQLAKLTTMIGELDVELKEINRTVSETVKFTDDQLQEYETLRGDCDRICAPQIQIQNNLISEKRIIDRELDTLRREKEGLEEKVIQMERQEEQVMIELERNRSEVDESQKAYYDNEEKIKTLQKEIENCHNMVEKYRVDLKEAESKVCYVDASKAQLEKEKKFNEMFTVAKEKYPGVFGRFIDLGAPSQKSLTVAVSAAMGFNMDVIVVDTWDTSKALFDHLKLIRYGSVKCHPLETVKVMDLDPRIAKLGGSCVPAMNCIKFTPDNESVRKAFQAILGDTVIVDTLGEARDLLRRARNMKLKIKIITLKGEKVLRNGNFTVDSHATARETNRFRAKEVQDWQSIVYNNRTHLQENEGRFQILQSKMLQLKHSSQMILEKTRQSKSALESTESRIQTRKDDFCAHQERIEQLGSQMQTIESKLSKLDLKINDISDNIHKEERNHFEKLSFDLGLNDVRQLEEEVKKGKQLKDARKDEISKKSSKAKTEKSRLEGNIRGVQEAHEKAEKVLNETEKEMKKVHKLCDAVTVEYDESKDKIEKLKEKLDICKRKDIEAETAVKTGREMMRRALAPQHEIETKLSACKSKIEHAESDKTDILKQVDVQSIPIQLLDGTIESFKSQGYEGCEVDFSSLSSEEKSLPSDKVRSLIEQCTRDRARLQIQIDKSTPNLKAIEKYADLVQQLKVTCEEATKAVDKSREIEEEYKKCKGIRRKTFMACFTHVAKRVDEIYQEMTKPDVDSLGGSAYLDLDDEDLPFNGGTKYHTMPPAKRFRDMHQLSGGEKSIAALALLFAMHSWSPAPFFVLDEVDAALDVKNVQSLGKYLQKANFQAIVISLKDRLYSESDILIGICKDVEAESSKVITLDLTAY